MCQLKWVLLGGKSFQTCLILACIFKTNLSPSRNKILKYIPISDSLIMFHKDPEFQFWSFENKLSAMYGELIDGNL